MVRVLVGSPVRQKPEILAYFLESLKTLKTSRTGNESQQISLDYLFVDDNVDPAAQSLLRSFHREGSQVYIRDAGVRIGRYDCNGPTHAWREDLIWKVAEFKDSMIRYALLSGYDYLFLIDSDLVLHPETLLHLLSLGKDIVCEIFWTKWQPGSPELPQVWLRDQYTLYHSARGENLSKEEIYARTMAFLEQLKVPGVYEVGGLGACTLISRRAMESGVCFKEIPNVSFWGEDRHFCIRAAALGFKLYVDTNFPAYHIYRDEDLIKLRGLIPPPSGSNM